VSELHCDVSGVGVPAIFVHGSFGWGAETFAEQRPLADGHRVILVDRRGYGGSRFAQAKGWPADMRDIADLLDEAGPAHLIGQSYGAVVALLAAGLVPEQVLSLVAIEPPAFEVAHGDPAADATVAAMRPIFARAGAMSAREFTTAWAQARGMTDDRIAEWINGFEVEGDLGSAAMEAARLERWPGDAPFEFDALAAARFPKVLVRGAWLPEVAGSVGAGRDFAAVCETIAARIGARVVVFEHSTHNPQLQEPDAFNQLLRDLWGRD
jgi:pimeloyl-ACP methyl ester carboxylesterase